jgi:hypothetical protein
MRQRIKYLPCFCHGSNGFCVLTIPAINVGAFSGAAVRFGERVYKGQGLR